MTCALFSVIIFTEVEVFTIDFAEDQLNQVYDVTGDWRGIDEGLDGLVDPLPLLGIRLAEVLVVSFSESVRLDLGKRFGVCLEIDSLSGFRRHKEDHASEDAQQNSHRVHFALIYFFVIYNYNKQIQTA